MRQIGCFTSDSCSRLILFLLPIYVMLILAGSSIRLAHSSEKNKNPDAPIWIPCLRIGSGFESESGPVGKRVNALALGTTGALWVATDRGLSRFDGARFRHFGAAHNLPHLEITDIIPWKMGVVAATPRGLVSVTEPYDGDVSVQLLVSGAISSIAKDGDRVWYAGITLADKSRPILGFFPLDNDSLTEEQGKSLEIDRPITRLLVGPGDLLLRQDCSGLWQWFDAMGNLSTVETGNWLKPDHSIRCGEMAYMVAAGRLLRMDTLKARENVTFPSSQPATLITPRPLISEQPFFSFWASFGQVHAIIDSNDNISRKFFCPISSELRCLAEDFLGRIWLGTEDGLYMTDPRVERLSFPSVGDMGEKIKSPSSDSPNSGKAHGPVSSGFTQNGDIWMARNNWICPPSGKSASQVPIMAPGKVTSVDWGDPPVVGTEEGLYRLKGHIFEPVAFGSSSSTNLQYESAWEHAKKLERKKALLDEILKIEAIKTRILKDFSIDDLRKWEKSGVLLDKVWKHIYAVLISSYEEAKDGLYKHRIISISRSHSGMIAVETKMKGVKSSSTYIFDSISINNPPVRLPIQKKFPRIFAAIHTPDGIVVQANNKLFRMDGLDLISIPTPHFIRPHLRLEKQFRCIPEAFRVFRKTDEAVWILKGNKRFEKALEFKKQEKVYDFLLDDDNQGVILAGEFSDGTLIHLRNGKRTPIYLPTKNALNQKRSQYSNRFFRDRNGREWINIQEWETNKWHRKVYYRDFGLHSFQLVKTEDEEPFEAFIHFLEEPKNRLWLIGYSQSEGRYYRDYAWVVDDDATPSRVAELKKRCYGMTFVNTYDQNGGNVWVCGANSYLASINPASFSVSEYSEIIQTFFQNKDNKIPGLKGITSDGKSLLIAYEYVENHPYEFGVIRFAPESGSVEYIQLCDRAEIPDAIGYSVSYTASFARSSRGDMALAYSRRASLTSLERTKFDSQLWLRESGSDKFVRIGEFSEKIILKSSKDKSLITMGTEGGAIYSLNPEKKLMQLWPALTPPTDFGLPIRAAAAFRKNEWIVLGKGPYVFHYNELGEATPISDGIPPWIGAVEPELAENEGILLFQKKNGVLLKYDKNKAWSLHPTSFDDDGEHAIRAFTASSNGIKPGEPGKVYVVASEALWLYSGDENRFRFLDRVPEASKKYLDNCLLSADEKGVWLATSNGLYRFDLKKGRKITETNSQGWSTPLGLPTKKINAISAKDSTEVFLFTPSGPSIGKLQDGGWWRFQSTVNSGVAGTEIRAVENITVNKKNYVLVGSDKGVSAVDWSGKRKKMFNPSEWSYLDMNNGLLDNQVYCLHLSDNGLIWVGTAKGVSVLSPTVSKTGRLEFTMIKKCTLPFDLPNGKVMSITTDSQGQRAWLLLKIEETIYENKLFIVAPKTSTKEFRHVLWDLKENLVIDVVPFLFSGDRKIHQGPSIAGRPPRILMRDIMEQWTIWDPEFYLKPRIEMNQWYFFSTADIPKPTFRPAPSKTAAFDIQWLDASLTPTPLLGGLRMAPDFWGEEKKDATIFAKLSSDPNNVMHYTWAALPQLRWKSQRVLRLIIVFGALAVFTGAAFVYIRRRIKMLKRLRGKEIPYIVGEVIEDKDKFYGRDDDLQELRNSIASASYLVTANFRHGKSSLQHRLTRELETAKDPRYVYLPIYIDMARFSGKDNDFFYFLGRFLVQLAREYEISTQVVDELERTIVSRPSNYDVEAFESDLDILLDHWIATWVPRKPVIVFQIDEIGFFERLDHILLSQLRSVFTQKPLFRTVMSGVEIPHFDVEITSEWWNFMKLKKLMPLKPDEARKLIESPAKALFKFHNDAVEEIMIEAQRVPFELQKLCADLLNYKYAQPKLTRKIRLEDFHNSLQFRKADRL